MQDTLKIVLIQSPLQWENPIENRRNFTHKIEEIGEQVDLILLPEMFTTGFTMSPEPLAETMQGDTVKWMQKMASQMNAAVGGSMIIFEQGQYFNRFIFSKPDGLTEFYDKRHTFSFAGEDKVYERGTKRIIVDYKGWKICPLICYDLRFPVWSRNTENYDVLLYVANWPKQRIYAWDALLKSRAIENMSYCIGVNRIGKDGYGHEYIGHSAVYDGLGTLISNNNEEESSQIVTIRKQHLESIREDLMFLNDRDRFNFEE